MSAPNCGERLTGHGSEWRDANLSPEDARTATNWVEQKIDKRSMLTNKDRVEDVRDIMWQLEKDGEIVVHRIRDEHEPIEVKDALRLDQAYPHDAALAPQVLRTMRQYSGLPRVAPVADELDG